MTCPVRCSQDSIKAPRPLLVKVPFHTVQVGSVFRESSQNIELGSPGTLNANLSGCMHVCLSLFVFFFFLSLLASLKLCLSVSLYVCVQVCLPHCLQLCLSVCLSDSVCKPAALYQQCRQHGMSTNQSVCVPVRLSVGSRALARLISVLTSHILGSKKISQIKGNKITSPPRPPPPPPTPPLHPPQARLETRVCVCVCVYVSVCVCVCVWA